MEENRVRNDKSSKHSTAIFTLISEVFILKFLSSLRSSESLVTTIAYPCVPKGPSESVSQYTSWVLPRVHLNWTPDYQKHVDINQEVGERHLKLIKESRLL